ncbi:hypothetical protein CL618_02140 [archaeon]|nr:hypothetical protein [archaeon]
MIDIILAILLGLIAGTITGLTPGLHLNTVSLFTFTFSPFLLTYTTPIILAVFIISMAINHTFMNSIPAIFIGAPESSDNALTVLPGHKYLLKKKGFEALTLTVIGSLFSLIIGILLTPIIIKILPIIYTTIKDYIGYLLLITISLLILRDQKRLIALIIFLLAGTYGLATLNLNIQNPLFPMLSSLFGISGLVLSLKNKTTIPKQIITYPKIFTKQTFKAVFSGTLIGTFTTLMPGLGPAQAAIIASQLTKLKDSGFLILVGALDTLAMVTSFIAIYSIDKARNGAVIIIGKLIETITLQNLILFLTVTLITGIIATFLTLKFAKFSSSLITKINYQKLGISIIILITIMTFWLSSYQGLLVLTIGSFLGLLPPLLGTGKNHLMGCLIIPTILYLIL